MAVPLTKHEKDLCGPPRSVEYYAEKHQFTAEELARFNSCVAGDPISDYIGRPGEQTSVILTDREEREGVSAIVANRIAAENPEACNFPQPEKTELPLETVHQFGKAPVAELAAVA